MRYPYPLHPPMSARLLRLYTPIWARYSTSESHQLKERKLNPMGVMLMGFWWTWPRLNLTMEHDLPPRKWPVWSHQCPPRFRKEQSSQYPPTEWPLRFCQLPWRMMPVQSYQQDQRMVQPLRCPLIVSGREPQSCTGLPLLVAQFTVPMTTKRITTKWAAYKNGWAIIRIGKQFWKGRQWCWHTIIEEWGTTPRWSFHK